MTVHYGFGSDKGKFFSLMQGASAEISHESKDAVSLEQMIGKVLFCKVIKYLNKVSHRLRGNGPESLE